MIFRNYNPNPVFHPRPRSGVGGLYVRKRMKPKFRVLMGILLLAIPLGALARLTLFNPAWMIQMRYPMATLHINRINSPNTYWWAEFGENLGIPMTAPDRYLNVAIDRHHGDLDLHHLTDASELWISNSRVVDLSAYYLHPGNLSCPVFESCDLSGLPEEQRVWLAPYAPNPEHPEIYPNTLHIPYESRYRP